MQQYYFIKYSSNINEIGVEFPVSKIIFPDGSTLSEVAPKLTNSIYEFPVDIPNEIIFEINDTKAILTDVIRQIFFMNYLLISNRFLELLLHYKLSENKLYKPVLKYSNKEMFSSYNLLCIPSLGFEVVNFSKSNLFIGDSIGKKIKEIKIKSVDEYSKVANELLLFHTKPYSYLRFDTISLNNKFDSNLDLFKLSFFDSYYIISEKLKNQINYCNITGIEMTKVPVNHFLLP